MPRLNQAYSLLPAITKLLTLLFLTSFPSLSAALPSDRLQAINIEADKAIFDDKKGKTSYLGHVLLKQGTLEIQSSEINIYQNSAQKIERLVAESKPELTTLKQQIQTTEGALQWVSAEAETISYSMQRGKIKLSGSAKIEKGDAIIASNEILYDINSGIFKASQNKASKDQNKGEDAGNSRVRITIPAQSLPQSSATPE